MSVDFRPSEVFLAPVPLTSCFGKSELEIAAACLVRACQDHDDDWAALTRVQIAATVSRDIESKREPIFSMAGNPFVHPDWLGLWKTGFVAYEVGTDHVERVHFTPAGYERIRRWVIPGAAGFSTS